jgi:hypothetical protein
VRRFVECVTGSENDGGLALQLEFHLALVDDAKGWHRMLMGWCCCSDSHFDALGFDVAGLVVFRQRLQHFVFTTERRIAPGGGRTE